MAKEGLGYAPHSELVHYHLNFPEKVSKKAPEVLEVLGERTQFMVYKDYHKSYVVPYVEDMLLSTADLGLDVAKALKLMVPDIGKVIQLHDLPNLDKTQVNRVGKGNYYIDLPDCCVFQDDQFLVLLHNGDTVVDMSIFKKR